MKFRLLVLLLALAMLLCACGGDADRTEKNDGDSKEPVEDVITEPTQPMVVQAVDFQMEYDQDTMKEYAVIAGLDANGAAVWQIETYHYDVAQMTCASPIGMWEDRYYYAEGGTVVALDRETGTTLWVNDRFHGYPAGEKACLILPDGTICATGYFGPDLIVIDKNGETLTYIDTIDMDIYWPYAIVLENDRIVITFEGGPNGSDVYQFVLDPETWEVVE